MKDKNIYLYHIRDNIDFILEFTDGKFDNLYNDKKVKLAVERCFGIIGEATSKLAEETKLQYPEVEWQKIKNFRNKLAHDYFDIDYDKVWKIIADELPVLKAQIAKIIIDVYGENHL